MVGELTPYLRNRFQGFIAYFQKQWIQKMGPQGFSVFGLQARTNNVIESFHAVLLRHQGIHAFAWSFLCKFDQWSKVTLDIENVSQKS